MTYVFSPSNKNFYPTELEADYRKSNAWPDDGIEVSDEMFEQFSGTPPQGKMRGSGGDSMPAWIDLPPPTKEELVNTAKNTQSALISQANNYMNSRQWPGKAAVGRLKGDDLAAYNTWLDYLDALYAVDTSKAPDISWPQKPS